jgi:hypothetical protein
MRGHANTAKQILEAGYFFALTHVHKSIHTVERRRRVNDEVEHVLNTRPISFVWNGAPED